MEEEIALKTDRAWLEIDLNHLEHNIREIKKIISPKTKIMAIVKANAYGHGMIPISKKLNEIGIEDFAVATLTEGINLRKNGIKGNILILGYTSIENVKYVVEYDLTQTIVDKEYAKKLSDLSLGKKIKVHIKINTGMNRIGISANDIESIKEIYQYSNLEVLGIFSHLCVADSKKEENVEFSKRQINFFQRVLEELKNSKIDTGYTHIQSSYGILNYPELQYDYVRPGIIMYGVHSEENVETGLSINLKPVLSLKARITSIKEIKNRETVGYGRCYQAKDNKKIATVSIGYADGYPRNLSSQSTKVMINNQYAEIIGRICMDQLMIDITGINNVKQGDIVTLIGENQISVERLARYSDTITNELLSRMGHRLPIVIIGEKSENI